MTSSETLRCKECGIIFNTIEDLYEHQKSEEEDKMLRIKDSKLLMCIIL